MKWWKDEMDTQARVGPALKKLRLDAGLTGGEVAAFIRCSVSSIYMLEAGYTGSLKLVEAYAWALGYELSDLEIPKPGITFMNTAKRKREKAAAEASALKRAPRHAVRRVA
jgi:transcriptional regulator with XRE-family HTH domain